LAILNSFLRGIMNILNKLQARTSIIFLDEPLTNLLGLELHKLESKYVRRTNRTGGYLTSAKYVNGEYVYGTTDARSASSPAVGSSRQHSSTSRRPSSSHRDRGPTYSSESMTAAEREQRRAEREKRRVERASVKAIAEAARTRPPKKKAKAEKTGSASSSSPPKSKN
jgi:hypothetical protein